MDFETLNKYEGELHPYKTAEIKKDLLKERETEIHDLLAENNPEKANEIISGLNEGDFRFEDKMQRTLMNHHYANAEKDPTAKEKIFKIISETKKQLSQEGRIGKYEKTFKEKFTGPRSTDSFIEDAKTPSDFFRNALWGNNPEQAEIILNEMRANGDSNEKIDHRENELMEFYIKKGDVDSANRIIENMTPNEHNEKYNSKKGRINKLSGIVDDENKEK